MSGEALARCTECGWTGLRYLEATGSAFIDAFRAIALAAGGHRPADRCHECKTGEVVHVRGERERAAAVQAEVGRALTAALDGDSVRVSAIPTYATHDALRLYARSYGREAGVDLDAFLLERRPRHALLDAAAALLDELRRSRTPEERADARDPCPVCGDSMDRNRHHQRVRPAGLLRLVSVDATADAVRHRYSIACATIDTCQRPSCIERGGKPDDPLRSGPVTLRLVDRGRP